MLASGEVSATASIQQVPAAPLSLHAYLRRFCGLLAYFLSARISLVQNVKCHLTGPAICFQSLERISSRLSAKNRLLLHSISGTAFPFTSTFESVNRDFQLRRLYHLKKVIPHLGSRRESGKLGLNPNSRLCMRLPLPGSLRKQS